MDRLSISQSYPNPPCKYVFSLNDDGEEDTYMSNDFPELDKEQYEQMHQIVFDHRKDYNTHLSLCTEEDGIMLVRTNLVNTLSGFFASAVCAERNEEGLCRRKIAKLGNTPEARKESQCKYKKIDAPDEKTSEFLDGLYDKNGQFAVKGFMGRKKPFTKLVNKKIDHLD